MHNQKNLNILRWIARVWSLPAILFFAAEILFPHAGDAPVPTIDWIMLGLQITAVIGLALAWRWDLIGGTLSVLTMLTSMLLFAIFRQDFPLEAGLIWTGFIVLPAVLFVYCGLQKPAQDKPTHLSTP